MKTLLLIAAALFLSVEPSHAAIASWYSSDSVKKEGTCKADRCYTASGKEIHELERKGILFAASASLPLKSRASICSKETGRCVEVTILDRGGFKKYGRSIDLCKEAFRQISQTRQGLTEVSIRRIA
jgi:rare lipoprotein A